MYIINNSFSHDWQSCNVNERSIDSYMGTKTERNVCEKNTSKHNGLLVLTTRCPFMEIMQTRAWRTRTAPTPVTDLPTLAALREHPVHPMHPLLRTCSGHRRVSFTGIPMRTARKTKEAASSKKVNLIRVSNIRVT